MYKKLGGQIAQGAFVRTYFMVKDELKQEKLKKQNGRGARHRQSRSHTREREKKLSMHSYSYYCLFIAVSAVQYVR